MWRAVALAGPAARKITKPKPAKKRVTVKKRAIAIKRITARKRAG
jgi:hypothetical protein